MYKASAPGSLMLLGEHAVLHGYPALCAAVDHRITVQLDLLSEPVLEIVSSLGTYREPLNNLRVDPNFKFILAAVRLYERELSEGIRLTVKADFSSTIGFGSSAAVTLATLHVLAQLFGENVAPHTLAVQAKSVIVGVQGRGSGADAAASAFGGIVRIQEKDSIWDINRLALPSLPPICPVYCGYKKPTPEVIEVVEAHRQQNPSEVEGIFKAMGASCKPFSEALSVQNLSAAGEVMNQNFTLQEALGVSNLDCANIVEGLRSEKGMAGAKISGSGLGDCVIGLGQSQAHIDGYETLEARIADEGVRIE